MKKYLSILVFLLIFPQVSYGETPVKINDQIQREKYRFAIDLIRALRYCIQGSKIALIKTQTSKEEMEISKKKLSEQSEKLKEIEKKLNEGGSFSSFNRELDSIIIPKADTDNWHLLLIEANYLYRDKLIQARTVMENWKDSEDKDIEKVSEGFLKGLDDLFFSTDQLIKLAKNLSMDQSHMDLLEKIDESGKDKIKWSSVELLHVISSIETKKEPLHIYLSEKQLLSIVQNIDDIFKEEFDAKEKPFPFYAIFPLGGIKLFILKGIKDTEERSN